MLVQAFIGGRLDYCNSILVAADRLVTGARKYDDISLKLCELHWLPVRKRITLKLAVLVFKCLHGLHHHT